MKCIPDIAYMDHACPAQKLDLYLPDCGKFPVFIYFHGGGLSSGDKRDVPFLTELAEAGIAVVSANYRMYPDAAFPDFLEDAATAVAWTMANIGQYGQPTGFFIGGSSAGGYITQMLCFDGHYLARHGIDAQSVNGYVMDAGQPTTHFRVLAERGQDERRVMIDDAAPLFFLDRPRTYPPMLIIVAEHDMVNRYEQTMLLVQTLKHLKCPEERVELQYVRGSRHCEYLGWSRPDGSNYFAALVKDFVARHAG